MVDRWSGSGAAWVVEPARTCSEREGRGLVGLSDVAAPSCAPTPASRLRPAEQGPARRGRRAVAASSGSEKRRAEGGSDEFWLGGEGTTEQWVPLVGERNCHISTTKTGQIYHVMATSQQNHLKLGFGLHFVRFRPLRVLNVRFYYLMLKTRLLCYFKGANKVDFFQIKN
jgi:hypothetical protein